mmetsp:Transcript_6818/g.18899  ORF Transcript_6818/g.18899 Transcript_6818/m.18899 type:complete len:270 (+) Transcript_6818:4081-4890(+)
MKAFVGEVHKTPVASVHADHHGDVGRGDLVEQPGGREGEVRNPERVLGKGVKGFGRQGKEAVHIDLQAVLGARVALRALPGHRLLEGIGPGLLPPLAAPAIPPVAWVHLPGDVGEGVGAQELTRRGHDGPVEERVGLGVQEVHHDVQRSRGLAAQGHTGSVAAESCDVVTHPTESSLLILVRQDGRGDVLIPVLDRRVPCIAEHAKPVVQGHHHSIGHAGEVSAIQMLVVGTTKEVHASRQPHQHGEVLRALAGFVVRHEDVEVQAVLR